MVSLVEGNFTKNLKNKVDLVKNSPERATYLGWCPASGGCDQAVAKIADQARISQCQCRSGKGTRTRNLGGMPKARLAAAWVRRNTTRGTK